VFRTRHDAAAFEAVRPLAVFMVRLVAIYVMADAVGIVFGGALRGAGDTFKTMLLTVSGHAVGASLYLRYRAGRWRRIRVLEAVPGPGVDGAPVSDTA
jgi:hypothetical protein